MNLSEDEKPRKRALLGHLAIVVPLNVIVTAAFLVTLFEYHLYSEPIFYLGLSVIPAWWAIVFLSARWLPRIMSPSLVWWFWLGIFGAGFIVAYAVGLDVMLRLGYTDSGGILLLFYGILPLNIYACMLFICLIWRLRHPNQP
jgi:hypothetical protein